MGATRRQRRAAAQGFFGVTGRYYPPQSAAAGAPRPRVVADPEEAVASIRQYSRRLRKLQQVEIEDLLRARHFRDRSLFHAARGPPEGLEMRLFCLLHGFPRRVPAQQELVGEHPTIYKPTVCISLPKRENLLESKFYEFEVPDSEPECDIGIATQSKPSVRVETASRAKENAECQNSNGDSKTYTD